MSDVSSNFRKFLLADAEIGRMAGERVHEDHVPQVPKGQSQKDYIWFRKRQVQRAETLDSSAGEGPQTVWFDVECVSTIPNNAKRLSEAVSARCSCYRGSFGSMRAQGVFVADQDADYVPQSVGGDEGFSVETLDVQVCV